MTYSTKDFSKKTIKTLAQKKISIIGARWIPGTDGSFANGEIGYELNNDGQGQIRTFREVLDMAKEA